MSVAPPRHTEVIIAGGGLAGIVAASELLDQGRKVLLIDKDRPDKFGGLAREAFGGVHLIGTRHQRRLGIADSPELAWEDWQRVAEYEPADEWPQRWGRFYCEHSLEYIFEFLDRRRVTFLPVVYWPERGVYAPGNTVPRWHIAWGTGYEIVQRVVAALDAHPRRSNLEVLFDTEVSCLDVTNGRVVGVMGRRMQPPPATPNGRATEPGDDVHFRADHVVIASGGICGGDMRSVRAHWYQPWGQPPETLLNGAHVYGDGLLHQQAAGIGAAVTHLDLHWHYAAGIHHAARRRPNDGLSLVPPRSALWMNAHGRRIMSPGPMIAYGDTRHLVAAVLQQPGQYSWQVMNWKIAIKELGVSGCDYMTVFRYKQRLRLLASLALGNRTLVRQLIDDCPEDIVVADGLDELMDRMDAKNLYGLKLDRERMEHDIRAWDAMIERGPAYHNDEQLRRIANFRSYRGDRLRTCRFQRILDPRARPLIAIREFILARKSLGGIQTDLECRVLGAADGKPIPGLYAVGEAAGFGGGGIHGKGSLEGTFLGSCVLTGRVAGRRIGQ